ncbi:MAG: RNA recognition motif domain-containing protein [Desulfomonilaceae bacterium]
MGINIYVGNLSYDTTEDQLRQLFEAYGAVTSAKIIMDQYTGRSKGFGFIEMGDREEGMKAIKELDSKEVGDRSLNVNEARAKRESRGGGRDNRGQRW